MALKWKIKTVWIVMLLFGASASELFAQDTLYLYSGSRLFGKVKRMELGVVTFDIKDADVVTVQFEKIKTMYVHSRLMKIETTFNQRLTGYIETSTQNGTFRLVWHDDTINVIINTVVTAVPFGENFRHSISAYIGTGYSYTRSSDVGRLNLDGRFNYTKERIDASVNASFIFTQETNTFLRDRENVSLIGNYYVSPTWFLQASLNYQRNLQLGLLSRVQQGVALGNRFLATSRMQARCYAGYVLNQEQNTEGDKQNALSEIPIGVNYQFYRYSNPRFLVSLNEVLYLGVNQNGRIRQDGELKITWKFWTNLTVGLNTYHNYDSQPPSTGNPNLDYGIVFTAGYELK